MSMAGNDLPMGAGNGAKVEMTDRRKAVMRAFRKRGNPWARPEDVAKWIGCEPLEAQYEMNKLRGDDLFLRSSGEYHLSEKGVAYVIENLD
jgi:hypothetical protein